MVSIRSSINTPGLVTNPGPNSWATESSIDLALTLRGGQNPDVPTPQANSSNKPKVVYIEQPKLTRAIKNPPLLASGSYDDTIKIWDLATGACVSTLKGYGGAVYSVAWSPDIARLASGSLDGTIKIWDPATGACVSTLKGHGNTVLSVAWSPDIARLASGSRDKTIKI